METATDHNTIMHRNYKVPQKGMDAASAGTQPSAEEKSATTAFDEYGNTTGERESLDATDEETTNTYDDPQADNGKPSDSSSISTTVSGSSSISHSENDSPTDAAGALLMGGHGPSGDGTVQFVMYAKRVTYSYKESQPFLDESTPSGNMPRYEQRQPVSANTSAAFSEGASHSFDPAMPTPPHSNFVGGPGGPGRSAPRGAAAYTQLSPPPSAPQTTGTSVLYPLSDSYATPPSTAINAPSFSAAHPKSPSTGAGHSAAQAPQHEVTGRFSGRATSPSAAVDPMREKNDEEAPSERKRHWSATAGADENQPHRSRRIQIQRQAAEEYEEPSDEEDEGSYGTYTGSSYSDEEYSYSYSEDEEDYEYYEEFYEEEVEEDEEDEEEPRIDIIEGSGHGNTLHDILYGTPKAGANAKEKFSRDPRERMRSDSPYRTQTEGKPEPRRQGHLRPRHGSEEDEKQVPLRSTCAHPLEAADKVAAAHRRSATPERVRRHSHRHKKSAKGYEGTDNGDDEIHHHPASDAGVKHRKRFYEHGEPYTEGTFRSKGGRNKKEEGGHYGARADLDEIMEQSTSDLDSESNEMPHEPEGNDIQTPLRPLSAGGAEDVDDDFTAPSRGRSRNRKSRQLAKKVNEGDRRHHRSGAERMEAVRNTKLDSKEGGQVIRKEEPIGKSSQQKSIDSDYEDSDTTDDENEGMYPDKGTNEDTKPQRGLFTKEPFCSKEKTAGAKGNYKEGEEKPKRGLLVTCSCCVSKKKTDATANKPKTKSKGGLFSKCCCCCSKEKDSGVEEKKHKKKHKRGLLVTCNCCPSKKKTDATASKPKTKSKGGLFSKSGCCRSKEKDSGVEEKKHKGGSGGLFSSFFTMCCCKKSAKDQVADKKGKEADKVSKVSKSQQAKQEEEEEVATAETSEFEDGSEERASSPPKNAERRDTQVPSGSTCVAAAALNHEESGSEVSTPVSKRAAHPLTTRAQRGSATPSTSHAHFHNTAEDPSGVVPVMVSDVDEKDESSVSNSATAQQKRNYSHSHRRAVEDRSMRGHDMSRGRKHSERSRASGPMLPNEKRRHRSSSSGGRK